MYAADVDKPALAQRQLRHELITLARSGAGRRNSPGKPPRGQQQSPPSTAGREVLELPGMHYRLLLAAYRKAFGPKAPMPSAAQKVPPYDPAILELQSAVARAHPGIRCRPAGSCPAPRTGDPRGRPFCRGPRCRARQHQPGRPRACVRRHGGGQAGFKISRGQAPNMLAEALPTAARRSRIGSETVLRV